MHQQILILSFTLPKKKFIFPRFAQYIISVTTIVGKFLNDVTKIKFLSVSHKSLNSAEIF